MKHIIAYQGRVVNIVNAPPVEEGEVVWPVDDAYVVNVGDVFDHRDSQFDEIHIGIAQMLQRHEDAVRKLNRALRGAGTAANNSANAQGLPPAADTPDLTPAQFREFAKTFIP